MAKPDAMIVCERCGVTFLWTIEEQRCAADGERSPLCCMGCRYLLPGAGRQRGLVKWYSPRKKYGFISPHSGPDLFAHRSHFKGVGRLRQGDLVEFAIEETEKGVAAVDVQLLFRERAPAKT